MIEKTGRQTTPQPYSMPTVVRARDYHLYDRHGVRYLDFFQNHGRAILGHRPKGVLQALKSTTSRGLLAQYPSIYQRKLEKIVEILLPGYHMIRLYRDIRYVMSVLQQVLGLEGAPLTLPDPAISPLPPDAMCSLWRPFLSDVEVKAEVLIPILPFPGNFVCEIVCVRDESLAALFPPSDEISPMVLNLLIKAIGQLLSEGETFEKRYQRKQILHDVAVRSCGPYCVVDLDEDSYQDFRRRSLEERVILPPSVCVPIIIPALYEKGEQEGFASLVKEIFR